MSDPDPAQQSAEREALSDDPADRSLVDDVMLLVADGRSYAEAEFVYQKSRLGYVAGRGKAIAVYGGLAVFFTFFALMGLVFGAILILAEHYGTPAATALVAGGLLLLAALSLAAARRNIRGVQQAFTEETE